MTARGIRTYEIRRSKLDDPGYDGVRMATMHRVKGLEFRHVFVVAANKNVLPLSSAIIRTDTIAERESIAAERCLLYVALTRAQESTDLLLWSAVRVFTMSSAADAVCQAKCKKASYYERKLFFAGQELEQNLEKLVAEQALDISILRDVNSKNF